MASRNLSVIPNEQALFNLIKLFFPDLEMNLNDLKNPTPQFLLNFYAAFLSELGVNINTLSQIQLNQMTIISHVDMYNQTIPHLNIYQSINYFAKNIGIDDFSFSDMMNPIPKRTFHQLCAMMHFLEYCDNTVADLSPELDILSEQQKRKNDLLSNIEKLKREINKRATNRVKTAENIKEMEKTIEKDRQKLNELFKEKELQKQAMEAVRKLIQKDEEKELQYAKHIENLETNIEKLNSMIVKSPDKFKNELKDLQDKQEECIENVKSLKAQIEEKKRLTNLFAIKRNELETRLQTLRDILEISKSIDESKARSDALKKKCAKLSEEVEEVKLQISTGSQKSKALKSQLAEIKNRRNKQEAEIKEVIAAAEKEYEVILSKKKQIDEIRRKHDQLLNDCAMFNEWWDGQYERLCNEHEDDKKRFDKILEAVKRRNQRLLEDD